MDDDAAIAEAFVEVLSPLFTAAAVSEDKWRTAMPRLLSVAVEPVLPEGLMFFLTADVLDGRPAHVVHYRPLAVAAFVASLVTGVGGATNPLLAGCAVVGCLAALKDARTVVSRSEGTLFWVIYSAPRHSVRREEAARRFSDLAGSGLGLAAEDFSSALDGLVRLGCVAQSGDELRVVDKVLVRYATRPPETK